MEKVSNQKRTMKPLFSTVPLVVGNEPINLALIPLFFSTETQGTQGYTERHCERSEAIRSDFFTTKVHKGFSQRTQGANDATHIHVISKRFLASLEMTMRLVWRGGSSGGSIAAAAVAALCPPRLLSFRMERSRM